MKTKLPAILMIGLLLLAGCKTPVPTLSKSYQRTIEHSTQVDVPIVYEAMQIALSLTDTYQSDPNLVRKNTPYYQAMISHFGAHKSHQLVLELEKTLKKAGAYGEINTLIRLQALNYELQNGKLHNNRNYSIPLVYNIAPYPLFLLHNNKRLINSFIKETGFEAFYQQHKNQYASLVRINYALCNYAGMQQWLAQEFPNVPHESLRVVFSPLTGGLHNVRELRSRNGATKQTIMFVSAPDYEMSRTDWTFPEKSAYASRVVFTEINHTYINPVTDQYKAQLAAAMQNLSYWKADKVTGGYNSFILTFNEYMTWAAFTLYAHDTYPTDVFERVTAQQEVFMVKRGFTRFKEFNRELLHLYKQQPKEGKVEDLYPAIIKWMKTHYNTAQQQNTAS
ncbi:DUF4932 domain-containing protein [Pontibacter burrus]|uniref:DUF4932 domain-containing protein n=1 Tax=Pontibacter burrus TaxID=2704466 RepID=A0A6B3LVA1_9BACT|nr:DUF4932 domain-containing protein [Pontibacter burrus]NEM98176.1 DUF4932 domain-containing protein [Pontibacter burrus]